MATRSSRYRGAGEVVGEPRYPRSVPVARSELAAAQHHYSLQAVAVMVAILVIGYLLILRRRRPGERGPSRRTDPNRFELHPRHPGRPTAPPGNNRPGKPESLKGEEDHPDP